LYAIFFAKLSTGDEVNQQKSAASSFLELLKKMPADDKKKLGYFSSNDMSSLILGEPIPLYTFNIDKVMSYKKEGVLNDYLSLTGKVYVPVFEKGSARVFISVQEKKNGEWQGVGIGYTPLSKKWNKVSLLWPDGQPYQLVISHVMKSYFFIISSEKNENLTSMEKLEATDIISGNEKTITVDESQETLLLIKKNLKKLKL